ncbi:MAG: hypothetical protein U7126_15015 [Microcoleus sp.]
MELLHLQLPRGVGTGNWEQVIGNWELGIGNWELGIENQRLSTDSESETGFLSISGFHQQSLRRNPVSVVVAKEKPGFYQSLVFTENLSEETRFLWLSPRRNRVSINLWFSPKISQKKPGFCGCRQGETGFLSISGFHRKSLRRNPVSVVVAKEKPGFYQSLVFTENLSEETRFLWLSPRRNRVSINLWFSPKISQKKPGFCGCRQGETGFLRDLWFSPTVSKQKPGFWPRRAPKETGFL